MERHSKEMTGDGQRRELFARGALLCAAAVFGGSTVGCEPSGTDPDGTREQGFLPRVYIDGRQQEHRYLVFLPRDFSRGDRRPVILFLNGRGENGLDGLRQIANNFGSDVWQMREVFPFVVVAPQCRPGLSWSASGPEADAALAILDEIRKEYGTDPDRVYLTGVSSGGSGVWSLASAHPERFAAIVPLCGEGGDPGVLSEVNLPTWNFYNDGDSPGLVEDNRKLRAELIRFGRSPLVTEYHQGGHNCWERAYGMKGLYAWLLSHDRSKNRQWNRKFSLVDPEEMLDGWERRGTAEWEIEEGGILLGTGSAGSEAGVVIHPASLRDCEIHVDAWLADGTVARIGFFEPEKDSEAAVVVSIPFAEDGLGGVSTPDGDGSAPLDPAGQRQLRDAGWNDIRLIKRDDRLSVSINGWPALEYRDPILLGRRCRFGLLSPSAPGSEVRWRFLRWRSLDGIRASADDARSSNRVSGDPE